MRMASKSSIGVWVAAGLLVAGAMAWAGGPGLPEVAADTDGKVTGAAILASVGEYISPTEFHARMGDPARPDEEKCALYLAHKSFLDMISHSGGPLRGTLETGHSVVTVRLKCPGMDAPFTFDIPTIFSVATAAHSDTAEGQSFDTQMVSIEGRATDVPGFDSITLVGGSENGYDSPGHTSLIATAKEGVYTVDSTFKIGYRIEYTGSRSGPLAGTSDSVEGAVTMKAYGK
jgi:hypothetical protein